MNEILASQNVTSYLRRLDSARSKLGLPGAVGDAALCAGNPVYASVRRFVRQAGYRFKADPRSDYFLWPMMSLNATLRSKVILYSKNLNVLKKVDARRRSTLTFLDLRYVAPAKNFVLHESAHVIAETALASLFKTKPFAPSPRSPFAVERALFAESCANAIELFGSFFSSTPDDRLNYAFNSYLEGNARSDAQIRKLVNTLGPADTLAAIIAIYLFVNFRITKISATEADFVLSALASDLTSQRAPISKVKKALVELSQIAAQLNPRFINETSRIFLTQEGLDVARFYRAKPISKSAVRSSLKRLAPAIRWVANAVVYGHPTQK